MPNITFFRFNARLLLIFDGICDKILTKAVKITFAKGGLAMNMIARLDRHNYNPHWKHTVRYASRAIIRKGNMLAMVKSSSRGYYKFPGGGINKGESIIHALIRETLEETGLTIIPESIKELGYIHELRKSMYGSEIFEQYSFYHRAEVTDSLSETALDGYEIEEAFALEFIPPDIALAANTALCASYGSDFLNRENYILRAIISGTL